MIRMGVGNDYQIYLFRREIQIKETAPDMMKEMGMARINQYVFRAVDQVSIAVIGLGVAPDEGLEIFSDFH
jgi:hypothetical protein